MKSLDVAAIQKALPKMDDDELEEMQKAVKRLRQAVTGEARRRRGKKGPGVLGVHGRTYSR